MARRVPLDMPCEAFVTEDDDGGREEDVVVVALIEVDMVDEVGVDDEVVVGWLVEGVTVVGDDVAIDAGDVEPPNTQAGPSGIYTTTGLQWKPFPKRQTHTRAIVCLRKLDYCGLYHHRPILRHRQG